jgi:precorrin-4/cobalt-precorrin-4 C11-methyltransferase
MLNSLHPEKIKYTVLTFLCISVLFAGQAAFAGSGKFYIVGMGTTPDLITLRGVRAIEETRVIMLEDEMDRKAWKHLIGKKEVWIIPNSARRYFGLNPEKIKDPEKKEAVKKADKIRRKFIERITQAVRKGKTVSALQWGDPMMFGMTYYLEMLPEDIDSEVIPGVGAFQAASAAVKMSPPYGWDTNSVILTATDWPERSDKNRTLMSHKTSMIFYTMFLDYAALFKDLNHYYPVNTPVAVVCNAGDREQQKIIRSTVGNFLEEVNYKDLPVNMLMVGEFLTAGQARKDGLIDREDLNEMNE